MLVFQSLIVTEVKHDDKLILQKATSQLPFQDREQKLLCYSFVFRVLCHQHSLVHLQASP